MGMNMQITTLISKEKCLKTKKDGNGDKNTDRNINKENVYERYDGDYEAYYPKYANYSKSLETHREIILRLTKKKWVVLLLKPIQFKKEKFYADSK